MLFYLLLFMLFILKSGHEYSGDLFSAVFCNICKLFVPNVIQTLLLVVLIICFVCYLYVIILVDKAQRPTYSMILYKTL